MTIADTTTTDTGRAAVRTVLQRIYAAWAANDADAFAALYLDDASVVMPGVVHHSRDALRAAMAAGFTGPLQGSRGIDDTGSVRLVGPDTAIVVSTAGILMAGEDVLPREREVHATWVLVRRDDGWRIAAYANAPAH
jgi:uncharacterized protein (TIGR02246 family)